MNGAKKMSFMRSWRSRAQIFYSQYDSRYVGCHWLQFAPFLCTNLIGQGPELLTTPAAIKICGIAEFAKLNVSRLTALEPVEVSILAQLINMY